jgi:polyisoprenoid-binding protein YceI
MPGSPLFRPLPTTAEQQTFSRSASPNPFSRVDESVPAQRGRAKPPDGAGEDMRHRIAAMSIQAGNYKLGPDNATLRVKTGRHGAAAKAGHDLVIEVKAWEATLNVADDASASSLELTADPTSLHVVKGEGGVQALGDDDKADIRKTIDKDVLKQKSIAFTSSSVSEADGGLAVSGDLELGGKANPVEFVVNDDGGKLTGSATFNQSDWGIKPYSALFGALKVNDGVTVEVEGSLS